MTLAVQRFGRLDIAIANAGGPPPGKALEVTDDMIRAAVEQNLLASVRLVRAAVAPMTDGGFGRIVCITSSSVKQPISGLALSNTARTGLYAWCKTAATDLASDPATENITINLVGPGLHDTDRVRQLYGDATRRAASATPRTSAASSRSSAPPPPASSPARPSSSTAAPPSASKSSFL